MQLLIKNRNKINKKEMIFVLIFIYLLFLMWTFYTFSYDNADYQSYKTSYENSMNITDEKPQDLGFYYLSVFFRTIGFSYNGFLGVISFICIVLLGLTINRYSRARNFTLILYIIFPFFFDVVQVRNFFAASLIIYSIRFLEEKSKKNILLFMIFIGTAFLFHTIALVYLLFLLVFIQNKKKMIFLVSSISIFSSVFLLSSIQLLRNSTFALFLMRINPRILWYLSDNLNFSTRILFVIYIITILFLSSISYKRIALSNESILANKMPLIEDDFIKKNDFLYKLAIISVIFIVFVILDPTLFRTFRNILLIHYMIYSNLRSSYKFDNTFYFIFIKVCALSLAILSFWNFLYRDVYMYNYVTMALLQSNTIITAILNMGWLFLILFVVLIVSMLKIYNLRSVKLK